MAELIAIEIDAVEFLNLCSPPVSHSSVGYASVPAIIAALKYAPDEVLRRVFSEACPESAYASAVRDRDSAISRSTDLQSQRDAIATELRSVAAALGLSTDDTIESLAARCRTAVALGSIGDLRRRVEGAERELRAARLVLDEATTALAADGMEADVPIRIGWLARERDAANDRIKDLESSLDTDTYRAGINEWEKLLTRADRAEGQLREANTLLKQAEEFAVKFERERDSANRELARCRSEAEIEIGYWQEVASGRRAVIERDSAIRDRDNAQSARDVALSELALARESIRNLEEEINGLLKIGRPLAAPDSRPETELAPGSRWEGKKVITNDGNGLRIEVQDWRNRPGDGIHTFCVQHTNPYPRCDGYWIDPRDTIAVLRRAGLLPDAGVPRERVRLMLIKSASLGWENAYRVLRIGDRQEPDESIADRILSDYYREKVGKP